jgi:iron complex outermembrane receptor protein
MMKPAQPKVLIGKKTLLAQALAAALAGMPVGVQAQDDIEVLEVLGIRSSLRQSLDTKENANAIVDAINAEDIGKFPDKNVADSLQRVPGISVDRIWGEGREIFVRGTDSTLNLTMMNGQNVASAFWWANDNPSRGFNYDILASELVASLEVHKSAQADMDEGSIGGLVNVKTRRPMALDALTLQASAEAVYSDLPEETDPQFSGLFSWKNSDETFGALVTYNSQTRTMRRDGLEAFPTNDLYDVVDENGDVTPNTYVVWSGGSAIFQQDRERDTYNVTLQFMPSDGLDMALNHVKSDMDMDNSNQNFLFVTGGYKVANGDAIRDPQFITTSDGNRALVGGTALNANSVGAADEPIIRDSFVKSEVTDFDLTYQAEGWNLHGQVGTTEASGGSRHDRNYWFEGNTRQTLNLGPSTNEFGFLDLDPLDGSSMNLQPGALRDWIRIMEDEETYAQGDVQFDVDWNAFNAIKTGIKLRDHTIENHRTVGTVDMTHPGAAQLALLTLDDLSTGASPRLHGETASSGSLTQYAFLDEDLARQLVDSVLDAGAMVYAEDNNAFFKLNEDITALYVKADFETERLRGNVGLRWVDTDQTSDARQIEDGDVSPISVARSYTEVLPSFNIAYDLKEDLLLRGAISRAMARPTYSNLSSNLVINATSGVASAGNPNLDPTLADQYEIGVEWYFAEASLVSITYFNKALDTFVYNRTAVETINGQTLNVTRPFNADDGADIDGFELQWQQDFGNGFGVQANMTLTDASVPPVPGGPKLKLPGNSETQMNASLYYENDVYGVRLSYNSRSEAFGALTSGSQLSTDDYDQWDATANWYFSEQMALFFTAVNLTNEVIYQRTADGIPVGFYENGSRYSVGGRFRF